MCYLQQRRNIKTLPKEVKRKIISILGEKYVEQSNAKLSHEGKCFYCDRTKKQKNENAM